MKKIININLSGRVIPIEDSAYEKLQAYIESLRRYFNNEEGRDEIINDIESRIAELLSEKVRKGATHIVDADMDEIAASMGRPEDFEAEAAEEIKEGPKASQSTEEKFEYRAKRTRGRLYRDSNDKFIGGVCSGIANYLNIDPAIVRILFGIISFGGFGLGVLIYILLWIILPEKDLDGYLGKRLYRNPEDRVIGGVASGLAAYFNRRTSTIRFIFALPVILSIFSSVISGTLWHNGFDFFPNIVFGSLTGTFCLAYIILWMVLPEARSQYEKMEMRGEKVDVNSIRQNVKDEMENMKGRVKEWGQEVKETAQNLGNKAKEYANTRGKAFVAESGETIRRGGRGIGHAIGVLFKAFFLFIIGSIAFGLFVGFMVLLFGGIAWWPINNFLWTSNYQQVYFYGTLIFFLGIPLIALITWIIRRILRVRSRSSYLGWTFGGLWVIGWIVAVLFAASISKDIREYEHIDTNLTISQPVKGKMIVTVNEPRLIYSGNFAWINDDGEGWDLSSDTLKMSAVRFTYDRSNDSQYHVIIKRFSAGRNVNDALDRADKTIYHASYKDSVLDVGSGFAIEKSSKYRGQRVEVHILVPVGKKIRFDESVDDKLNPVNIHIYRRRGNYHREVEVTVHDKGEYPWRSNVDYVMGEDGRLRDAEGRSISNDEYQYRPANSTQADDSTATEKPETRDEKKKRLQDELKKLDEEDKKKNSSIPDKTNTNEEVTTPGHGPSPVFSLVDWM